MKIFCKNVYLIYGNHDKNYDRFGMFSWCGDYKKLKSDAGKIILFHCPVDDWDGMMHDALRLHEHQHNKFEYNLANAKKGYRRYDVGVDANEYAPSEEKVIREFLL